MPFPFHLAFPVRDIQETKRFYLEILGCTQGREDARWIDFDFFGHQLSAHVTSAEQGQPTNTVDGKQVPVRHFGVILSWEEWHAFADRIKGKVSFVIEPYVRFKGEIGEQATMFFLDPSGNALEFKAFRDDSQVFARAS